MSFLSSFQIFKIFSYRNWLFELWQSSRGAIWHDCKIERNRCRKFEVRLSFRQSSFIFFNYDAIYLFHRPMVTKPISATRSNGRASAQRITCSKSKKRKRKILQFSKKTVLKLAYNSPQTLFNSNVTKI